MVSSFSFNLQVKRMIGKLSYVYRKHPLPDFCLDALYCEGTQIEDIY